jgi:hypothetical protein
VIARSDSANGHARRILFARQPDPDSACLLRRDVCPWHPPRAPANAGVMRSHGLYRRYTATVAAAGLPAGLGDDAPVTEADLASLPGPARSYLRFMGVVGRPLDWSFQARFTGRFRMRPGAQWLPAEAWQYNSALAPARIFVMGVRLATAMPVTGRNTYQGGRGHFTARVLDTSRSPTATARNSTSASSPPTWMMPCSWLRRCCSRP